MTKSPESRLSQMVLRDQRWRLCESWVLNGSRVVQTGLHLVPDQCKQNNLAEAFPNRIFLFLNILILDFPGGAVDKNPPANSGDMGSIPGLGRFHMPQQLSPCATTTEPVHHKYWSLYALGPANHTWLAPAPQLLKPMCLEPVHYNERNHCNEQPSHHNQRAGPALQN